MSGNLIPDEMAQRTGRLINEAENVRAQAVDDLKTIYADLREELKSLGWRGAEVSEQVAAFKAAISEMRLDDEKKAKREAKGDLVSEYINVLTVSRARARVKAGKGVEVGVDTPHDPETGEILESVQSHDAAVVSAPAGSASDEMSAGEAAPSGLPTNSEPDQTSKSTAARNGAGKTGVTAEETATHSNPQASSSRQADKAEAPNSSPDASAVNSEPTFAARPKSLTKPLCRYPGEDRCAGYGSVTCHACLRAAREDEVAA